MSAEALARVLWDSPAWSKPWAELRLGQQEKMRATLEQAERIMADPGPLLAALAEAGVLGEERRAACSCVAHDAIPVECRYVTEWQEAGR